MPRLTRYISVHLRIDELACHDEARTPYPADWLLTRGKDLARAFEAIRARWNAPITITSAYRTALWNAHVGGALESQHVAGRALDLLPPEGVSVVDFWTGILDIAAAAGLHGVGYAAPSKGGFVHVDIRPGTGLTSWRY
jgi:uncharacterized protein YcbK (DUF882 family)